MDFIDKIKAFKNKFSRFARIAFSTWLLGMIAVCVLLFDGSGLNHPNWCRFFTFASVVVLWFFINVRELREMAGTSISRLLGMIPVIAPNSPLRFFLAALYILPGLLIFGHFTAELVIAAIADPIGKLEEMLPELIGTIPILGEVYDPQNSWLRIFSNDLSLFWTGLISLSYDILLLSLITLAVSAVARLLTGAASRKLVIRFFSGFSSVIYVLLLSNAVNALMAGSFLDASQVGQLFFLLDGLNSFFLILIYPVLIFGTVFLLSSFFLPFILYMGYFLVFVILFILTEGLGFDLNAAINSVPGLIISGALFFGGWFYSIGKNIWDHAPSDG